MMKNFATRLKSARVMQGLSMQDLCNLSKSQISKQAISRYEKGEMVPSNEKVLQLCQILNIKLDYFERTEKVSLNVIAFRKLEQLSKKKQQQIIEQTQDFLERYLELEDILNLDANFVNPILGLRIDGIADIEKAANLVREKWQLGDGPLHNIVELLEEQSIKVFDKIDIGDVSFSGMSASYSKNAPVIVLNSSIPIDRKRFTALHELGHVLLNLESLEEKIQEQYCNYFAASMLIPRQSFYKEFGDQQRYKIHIKELEIIKRQYGLSMLGILYRAKELKLMSNHTFQNYKKFFNKTGLYTKEPDVYEGREITSRLLQLLCRAIAEEVISITKAATLYNMKLAAFRKEIAISK